MSQSQDRSQDDTNSLGNEYDFVKLDLTQEELKLLIDWFEQATGDPTPTAKDVELRDYIWMHIIGNAK